MKAHGFTLLHLVLVTVFFAFVLSTGFPMLYSYMQMSRLHGALQAMTAALVDARVNAVEHYHPVIMCSSQDGLNCDGVGHWENGFIVFVDEDRNGRRSSGELPHLVQPPLKTGATIRSEFSNSHQVLYLPSGRVKRVDYFNVCINDVAASGRTIALGITGRPRPQKGAKHCPGNAIDSPPLVAHR